MTDVQRDSDKHQLKKQEWHVKATQGKTVYLMFAENVFRKHFVLESKSGKTTTDKATNKARKRFLTTKSAIDAELIQPSEQRKLKKRYGGGGGSNNAVDLGVLDLDSVLTEMASTLLAKQFGQAAEMEVVFTFSKPCVLQSDMAVEGLETKTVKVTHKPLVQGISFKVTPAGNGTTFTVGHCTGSS